MNGKISNVPALTKYKGIDIQLSHLTCSGPPFSAYYVVSTGSEEPPLPQWKAFKLPDTQFPDKVETIIAWGKAVRCTFSS